MNYLFIAYTIFFENEHTYVITTKVVFKCNLNVTTYCENTKESTSKNEILLLLPARSMFQCLVAGSRPKVVELICP